MESTATLHTCNFLVSTWTSNLERRTLSVLVSFFHVHAAGFAPVSYLDHISCCSHARVSASDTPRTRAHICKDLVISQVFVRATKTRIPPLNLPQDRCPHCPAANSFVTNCQRANNVLVDTRFRVGDRASSKADHDGRTFNPSSSMLLYYSNLFHVRWSRQRHQSFEHIY